MTNLKLQRACLFTEVIWFFMSRIAPPKNQLLTCISIYLYFMSDLFLMFT